MRRRLDSDCLRTALAPRTRELSAVLLVCAYAALLGLTHVLPRYDCLVFPPLAWGAFRLLEGARADKRLFAVLAAMGTLLAFGVLANLWTTGHEGRSAVLAGIIPWSDAGQFTSDAERILHGLPIVESSRRPLYVAVLAGVLRATGNDLRLALAVFTALYGLSLGYVAWETMRAHGRIAACLVFVVAFFWVRRFTGFVATEAASFPPGALAFGLLLRAADAIIARRRRAAVAFGVGLLAVTLALAARPGPLLVVPALLAWALWAFRGRARLVAFGCGAAGALVAVLAAKLVAARFATGATFGDYPNIVYALVHRGDLYTAMADHPELAALPPEARPAATLAILRQDLLREPSLAVIGPLDAFVSFLFGPHGFFSFVWTNPDDHVLEDGPLVRRLIAEGGMLAPLGHWVRQLGVRSLVNAGVMGAMGVAFTVACIGAVVRLFRRRHGRRHGLALFVMGAILASSVFAPTWIGEGMQMQTGVFAFVPCAVALGLGPVRRCARARSDLPVLATALALPAGAALLVVLVAKSPLPVAKSACGAGTISAVTVGGTRVLVRPLDAPPLLHNLAFLATHNPELVKAVRAAAKPGDALALLYDACAERTRIAFGPADVVTSAPGFRALQVTPRPEEPLVVEVAR